MPPPMRRPRKLSFRCRAGAAAATPRSGCSRAASGYIRGCTRRRIAWCLLRISTLTPQPLSSMQLRALNQAARELMLAQSSDWTFILDAETVTTYAAKRIETHLSHFHKLLNGIEIGSVRQRAIRTRDFLRTEIPIFTRSFIIVFFSHLLLEQILRSALLHQLFH